jgi:putative flippase GtrA
MRRTGARWIKFNVVGAIGIGVQLVVLTALKSGLRMDYLWATGLAVEATVIHNYFWHERFTWADRVAGNSWTRFLRFNLTTGMISIVGNILLMRILVGELHFNYFLANVLTIAGCSVANFLVNDRFVFDQP